GTKLRFLREYLSPRRFKASSQDESVASFVARHFDDEVVDRLAEPLLAGGYGGGGLEMEGRARRSLMGKMGKEGWKVTRAVLAAKHGRSSTGSLPLFTSLRGGMQALAEALVSKLPANSLRTSSPVQQIRYADRWHITTNEMEEPFDHLILAVPAYVAAALL